MKMIMTITMTMTMVRVTPSEVERALLVLENGKVMFDPLLCKKIPMNFLFSIQDPAASLYMKLVKNFFFLLEMGFYLQFYKGTSMFRKNKRLINGCTIGMC